MKKILVLATALTFSIAMNAEQNSKMQNDKTQTDHMDKKKDGVMMKDGKMMVKKDGKTMAMDKDMTMKNGTVVMTDGTVKMKNGKTMKMSEGDCIDMDGKMMTKDKISDQKMEK